MERPPFVRNLFVRLLVGSAVCGSLLAYSPTPALAADTAAPTAVAANWEPTSFAGAYNLLYDDRLRLVGYAQDTTTDALVTPSIAVVKVSLRRKICPACVWEYLRNSGVWAPGYVNYSLFAPQYDLGVTGSGLGAVHGYHWYFDVPTPLPSTSGTRLIQYFVNIRPEDASGNINTGLTALSVQVSPIDFQNPTRDLTPPASTISSPLDRGRWSPPFTVSGSIQDAGGIGWYGSVASARIFVRRTSDNFFMQANGSFAATHYEFTRAETATGPWFSGFNTDQTTHNATANFIWAPPAAPGAGGYAIKFKATDASANQEPTWIERIVTV